MGLAVEHHDLVGHAACLQRGNDVRTQAGNDGCHKLHGGLCALHQRSRGEETRCQVAHLGAAAPGQQRNDRRIRVEAQGCARGGAIRLHRNDIGQWMTHVAGRHALLGQQRRLERKDTKHMVGRCPNLFDSGGTPCPYRGAN